ncbi:Uncharacterised protein [Bordetella ansorpii]|uniref:Uncharacterized protein n=1 Tax=Bordetella ansorpii TaxID=288768 RepID=A0A157SH54_9BORD|nr:Uncharacterised protein [Bordetella ansorpii]
MTSHFSVIKKAEKRGMAGMLHRKKDFKPAKDAGS